MNISNDIPPEEGSMHELGSHVIHESGKPIIQSSLWNCIRRIREMESTMTRMYEHSDLTIMPVPKDRFGRYSRIALKPMKHEMEVI